MREECGRGEGRAHARACERLVVASNTLNKHTHWSANCEFFERKKKAGRKCCVPPSGGAIVIARCMGFWLHKV